MLISIMGSQGSGKSTLLEALAARGFKCVTRKTSRSILSEWGVTLAEVNTDKELTVKFQEEIIRRKWKDEHDVAMLPDDIWFTERSYADLFTYNLVALGHDNGMSDFVNRYYQRCMQAQQSYAHVFYLRAGMFNVEHDGVRGSNQHYSRMVDGVMSEITRQITLPSSYTTVDTPDLEQRVSIVTTFARAVQIRRAFIKD